MVFALHCPSFIFDLAASRVASEFLESELGLEAFSAKYSVALGELYSEIDQDSLHQAAEAMMQFLAEIEAGENAVILLTGYVHYRLYFEGPNRPRKLKPMFGSIEDPVKLKEWSHEGAAKGFRAYVFGLRSNTVPHAPVGWKLEDEESVPHLAELAAQKLSMIDIL